MVRRLLASTLLLVAACASEAPKRRAEPPRPADPWDDTPHSNEWLYATREASGGHPTECKAAFTWIEGEAECRGAGCVHAKDLAKDWLARCEPHDPDHVDAVKKALPDLAAKARQDASPCSEESEALLRDGCPKTGDCAEAVQAWATRCSKLEASPLTVRMLERVVERKTGRKGKLDGRSCEDLFADIGKGSSCSNTFACEAALKEVDAYRARCEVAGDKPGIAAAVLSLGITHGAGRPAAPVLTRAGALKNREVATALDDGMGAALSVCGERTSDLARYLAKRRECKDGEIVYARAWKRDGGLEVRLGKLAFPDDRTFSARFPSLAVDGEAELRDAQDLAAFEAELGKIAGLAQGSARDAAASLGKLVVAHALALHRSGAFREALSSKDAALVPAMRELGAQKAKAAKAKLTVAELAGFVARARTRAFADVGPDGAVAVGAATRATEFETEGVLTKGMAAYQEALKPGEAQAKLRKVDARTAKLALAYGKIQADTCGAAEKRLSDAEQKMLACAFGVQPCDEAGAAKLTKEIDDARQQADAARHQLDAVLTGAASSYKGELVERSSSAGCLEPWW